MRDWRSFAGVCGSLLAAAAVAFGAFGAHALRAQLDMAAVELWQTAVDYQFWHALGLIAACLIPDCGETRLRRAATLAFLVGIGLFCGSLFALALGAPRQIGILTPLGGCAFLMGWMMLALMFQKSRTE